MAGADVAMSDAEATTVLAIVKTDDNGQFSATYPPTPRAMRVNVTGDRLVPRTVYVASTNGTMNVTIGVFREDATFDLGYFRELARATHYAGTPPQPLMHWSASARVMIATTHPDGTAVSTALVDFATSVIAGSFAGLTGGTVSLIGIDRGPDSGSAPEGTLVVRWAPSISNPGVSPCSNTYPNRGLSAVVNLPETGCGCGPFQLNPTVIRHVLGHALGLWDTSGPAAEIMSERYHYSRQAVYYADQCDVPVSDREQAYAHYLYSRVVGNSDPDIDPFTTSGSR